MTAARKPTPAEVEALRRSELRPVEQDGTIADWWFLGDGDQINDEIAAQEYVADNPGVKIVRVHYQPVEIEDYCGVEILRCNNCGARWEGDAPLIEADGETFHGCPTCNTDAYLMEVSP